MLRRSAEPQGARQSVAVASKIPRQASQIAQRSACYQGGRYNRSRMIRLWSIPPPVSHPIPHEYSTALALVNPRHRFSPNPAQISLEAVVRRSGPTKWTASRQNRSLSASNHPEIAP